MSILAKFAAQIQQHQEVSQLDMTEAKKGGGGGKVWPEGWTLARLAEVIEVGNHATEFQGDVKDPAPQIILGFRMYDPDYCYTNDKGEITDPGVIRTFELTISQNEKAKAFKLFSKLNWQKTAKNFCELLGVGYMIQIKQTKKKDASGKEVNRSNLDLESILPPLDPRTKQMYEIPELAEEHAKLFLWNNPSIEQWESIAGNEGAESFSQKRIKEAVNFPGSAVEMLLAGANELFDQAPAEEAEPTPEPEVVQAAPAARPTAPAPKAPARMPAGLKIPTAPK